VHEPRRPFRARRSATSVQRDDAARAVARRLGASSARLAARATLSGACNTHAGRGRPAFVRVALAVAAAHFAEFSRAITGAAAPHATASGATTRAGAVLVRCALIVALAGAASALGRHCAAARAAAFVTTPADRAAGIVVRALRVIPTADHWRSRLPDRLSARGSSRDAHARLASVGLRLVSDAVTAAHWDVALYVAHALQGARTLRAIASRDARRSVIVGATELIRLAVGVGRAATEIRRRELATASATLTSGGAERWGFAFVWRRTRRVAIATRETTDLPDRTNSTAMGGRGGSRAAAAASRARVRRVSTAACYPSQKQHVPQSRSAHAVGPSLHNGALSA
jgi:hypothetical protein